MNISVFVRMFPCHKSGSMAVKDGRENISHRMGWGKLTAGRKSTTAVKLTELFLALDVKVLKIFSNKISDARNSLLVCYIADFREKRKRKTKSVRY